MGLSCLIVSYESTAPVAILETSVLMVVAIIICCRALARKKHPSIEWLCINC